MAADNNKYASMLSHARRESGEPVSVADTFHKAQLMKTSVVLPVELYKLVRLEAVRRRTTFEPMLADAVERFMDEPALDADDPYVERTVAKTSIRLPKQLADRLKIFAIENDTTQSKVVRCALLCLMEN